MQGQGQYHIASVQPRITFYRFSSDISETGIRSNSSAVSESSPGQRVTNRKGFSLNLFGSGGENLASSLVSFQTSKSLSSPEGKFQITLMPVIPAGSLKGVPWYDVLNSGDWVRIEASTGTSEGGTSSMSVMVGKIDSIKCDLTANSSGGISSRIIISGRDVVAGLTDLNIYINPYDFKTSNLFRSTVLSGLGFASPNTLGGTPNEFITNVLVSLASNQVGICSPTKVPRGVFNPEEEVSPVNWRYNLDRFRNAEEEPKPFAEDLWIDSLDVTSGVGSCRGVCWVKQILNQKNGSTSLWKILRNYQNPALNEMYIDTSYSATPYFVLRERPFVNINQGKSSPWFSLPLNKVPLDQVVSIDFTQGLDRVNYIYITATLSANAESSYMSSAPQINIDDMGRHGIRSLTYNTNYFHLSQSYSTGAPLIDGIVSGEENDKWISLLVNWNALNPYYHSGQVRLARMRPDIKIGEKVCFTGGPSPLHPIITPGDIEHEYTYTDYTDFSDPGTISRGSTPSDTPYHVGEATTGYVESVSHRWVASTGAGSTTVSLSRVYPEHLRIPHLEEAVRYWSGWFTENTQESAPHSEVSSSDPPPTFDYNNKAKFDSMVKELVSGMLLRKTSREIKGGF